jgi:hypothetical protein
MGGLPVSPSARARTAGRLAPLAAALLVVGFVAACSLAGPAEPTGTASPTATPDATPEGPSVGPPIASLTLADGTVHPGVLGSWSYREVFADAPWQNAAGLPRIDLGVSQEQLSVALPEGQVFARWSARTAGAADPLANQIRPLGADGADHRRDRFERASFTGPATGDWVIEVRLTVPDNDGEAAYYWYVAVP